VLKIRAYYDTQCHKGTYKGTYYGSFFIMDDLIFGETLRYNTGTKKGRFYAYAAIPEEHRPSYNGLTQKKISLGSDPNKVDSKRKAEIAKANKEHRNKIAAHDPLIAAAERLIEALIVEHDPVGKKLEVKHWYPRPLTTEELEGLRHYTIEESPAKTEYNRLLQALRNETYKLLYAEYQELSLPEAPVLDVEYWPDDGGGTEAVPIYDPYAVVIHEAVEAQIPRFAYWRPTGSFAAAKKELEAQGKTPKEIDEWFVALYQHSGFLSSTYDAWHRRDQINDAWVAFEDEHLAKTTGRAKSGKRYSDAVRAFDERFSRSLEVKRQKTFSEYKGYQEKFLAVIGDLDLSDLTLRHALAFVDHLERQGKAHQSITKYMSGVRAPIDLAVDVAFWIKDNPFKGLKLSGRGKPPVKRSKFSAEGLQHLFTMSIPHQEKLTLRILAVTGFRLEEAASLRWEDIKLGQGVSYFDLTDPTKILKTVNSHRRIPIHNDLMPYIEQHRELTGGEGNLFIYSPNKDGKVSSHASKKLTIYTRQCRDATKTTLSVHSIRHTVDTLMHRTGMEDSTRKYLMGHEMDPNDKTYLDVEDALQLLKEAVDKIDVSYLHGNKILTYSHPTGIAPNGIQNS
jgi:integrase